jgi:hypothetical protein
MAVSHFPTIINGTYDLYYVPRDAPSVPTTFDEASQVYLGCLQEGFNLTWSFASKEIQTECMGETVIDGVYLGVQTATISGIIQEYDNVRTTWETLIWPEGVMGALQDVGKQVLYSKLSSTLKAVPRTGTPAATNTTEWWFWAVYPEKDSDFEANFNFEEQVIPFTFRCYPVPATDSLTTPSIYFPSDDETQVTNYNTDYTRRFWSRG